MKKILTLAATALTLSLASQAQETFTNNYATQATDLFGTARYVGMGGAMGALGADISAISLNPASIGMFRRSSASFTAGALWQTDANTYGESRSRASFDQAGLVLSFSTGDSGLKYFNFAFNYQKKNNLSHTFIADNTGSSLFNYIDDVCGVLGGDQNINPIVETAIVAGLNDASYNSVYSGGNQFFRTMRGNTQSYDLNLSGNVNDRIFWGATVGIDVLRYKSDAIYDETWLTQVGDNNLSYSYNNYQELRGTGVNLKAGVIFRPIEDSPFRIGLTIETPTWYDIDYYGDCEFMTAFTDYQIDYDNRYRYYSGGNDLSYCLSTPWRFRVSAGSTFGSNLALDVEYEYADYNYLSQGYSEDYYDRFYDDVCTDVRKDKAMNRQTNNSLRAVHSFKAGLEWKPVSSFALRAGYNYYGSSCEKDAYSDHTIDSYAAEYLTATDYLLLGDVNIVTLGAGYADKNFYADIAWKYRMQNADFYHCYYPGNTQSARQINLDRHQLMLTLGYKF